MFRSLTAIFNRFQDTPPVVSATPVNAFATANIPEGPIQVVNAVPINTPATANIIPEGPIYITNAQPVDESVVQSPTTNVSTASLFRQSLNYLSTPEFMSMAAHTFTTLPLPMFNVTTISGTNSQHNRGRH